MTLYVVVKSVPVCQKMDIERTPQTSSFELTRQKCTNYVGNKTEINCQQLNTSSKLAFYLSPHFTLHVMPADLLRFATYNRLTKYSMKRFTHHLHCTN